jgi:hypothetical protein
MRLSSESAGAESLAARGAANRRIEVSLNMALPHRLESPI